METLPHPSPAVSPTHSLEDIVVLPMLEILPAVGEDAFLSDHGEDVGRSVLENLRCPVCTGYVEFDTAIPCCSKSCGHFVCFR